MASLKPKAEILNDLLSNLSKTHQKIECLASHEAWQILESTVAQFQRGREKGHVPERGGEPLRVTLGQLGFQRVR